MSCCADCDKSENAFRKIIVFGVLASAILLFVLRP